MYQRLILIGNLGRDPELRYTPQGTPVCNFSVATNRRYTDANGQMVEETTWFRVTTWGRLAETCNQYLRKGMRVLVEGRLIPDPSTGGPRLWTGQDGAVRASFEVRADVVRFLTTRAEAEEMAMAAEEEGLTYEPVDDLPGEEDEVPF